LKIDRSVLIDAIIASKLARVSYLLGGDKVLTFRNGETVLVANNALPIASCLPIEDFRVILQFAVALGKSLVP
jgi:hypothetical protein